jgi:hypothetical protein
MKISMTFDDGATMHWALSEEKITTDSYHGDYRKAARGGRIRVRKHASHLFTVS